MQTPEAHPRLHPHKPRLTPDDLRIRVDRFSCPADNPYPFPSDHVQTGTVPSASTKGACTVSSPPAARVRP